MDNKSTHPGSLKKRMGCNKDSTERDEAWSLDSRDGDKQPTTGEWLRSHRAIRRFRKTDQLCSYLYRVVCDASGLICRIDRVTGMQHPSDDKAPLDHIVGGCDGARTVSYKHMLHAIDVVTHNHRH